MTTNAIPPEVERFHEDLISAVQQLSEYRFLFSERNAPLRAITGQVYFERTAVHFQTAFILHIGRLTDPARTGSGPMAKDNLTLEALLELEQGASLKDGLQLIHEDVVALSKPIREVRNKLVAHRDLQIAMSNSGMSVPGFLDTVEAILRKLFDAVGLFYGEAGEKFLGIEVWLAPTYHGHVTELLFYLRQGRMFREVFEKLGAQAQGELPQWFWDAWHETPTYKAWQ
jgi:hypothetical protein